MIIRIAVQFTSEQNILRIHEVSWNTYHCKFLWLSISALFSISKIGIYSAISQIDNSDADLLDWLFCVWLLVNNMHYQGKFSHSVSNRCSSCSIFDLVYNINQNNIKGVSVCLYDCEATKHERLVFLSCPFCPGTRTLEELYNPSTWYLYPWHSFFHSAHLWSHFV